MGRKRYSFEQLEWLRLNYRIMELHDLVVVFNLIFGDDRSLASVRACLRNHRIKSGRHGRFEPGQKSWNAGKKGFMGANKTSFQKGHRPHNTRQLWSERESKDGYIEISVPERNPYTGFPRRFKSKHTWLWEQENGPVPAGHAVIFKDGDKRNFALDNLKLVSRAVLLIMNQHGYKDAPRALKPSILALARLEEKAGFRTHPPAGRRDKGKNYES